MKNTTHLSRRRFIGSTATLMAGTALVSHPILGAVLPGKGSKHPNSLIKGVQLGVITYSFRSMPDQSAAATLQYVLDCGINAIELMGDPAEAFAGKPESPVDRRTYYGLRRDSREGKLTGAQQQELERMESQLTAYNKEIATWRETVSMDKFEELRKLYNDAGVTIYAFKPAAFGKDNTDAEIEYGLRAAKTLGAGHVTLEHPGDDAQTKRLAALAEKYHMKIGYHGHEQQTPTFWDVALEQSPNNGLNLDLGHYVAAGNSNPLEIIQSKHERILSMHIKDRQSPAHGKDNLIWGSGDTPIAEALQLMRDNRYTFPATIELEYEIPEGSDAVKEVKRCLAYCKDALS